MSTIPPKVGPGDVYADFKSYSVKSKFLHLNSLFFKSDLDKKLLMPTADFKDILAISVSNKI